AHHRRRQAGRDRRGAEGACPGRARGHRPQVFRPCAGGERHLPPRRQGPDGGLLRLRHQPQGRPQPLHARRGRGGGCAQGLRGRGRACGQAPPPLPPAGERPCAQPRRGPAGRGGDAIRAAGRAGGGRGGGGAEGRAQPDHRRAADRHRPAHGERGGDAARPHPGAGADVPQQRLRRAGRGLSAPGWLRRLDRRAGGL
ncbi:MAG: Ribosome hibernation promoting factor Hpf, partial [uncultured Craurococcus sp.]